MTTRILMIDDHPSQIEGYKAILAYNNSNIPLSITAAYTLESAYDIIRRTTNSTGFDIVFLDKRLPPYPEKNIKSGEDLAMIIKQYLPQCKIVIITSHAESFVLYNIVKKIAPAGLLVKSDFSAEELLVAFDAILNDEIYYSETVKLSIRDLVSREEDLDSYDYQIIQLLSQGIKTKNIPEHVNLSQSAVEKRKALIKEYFGIEKGSDEDIIKEARKLGFV